MTASAGLAEDAPPLSVCFPENDPPRSLRADAQGFDVDVARLLAATLQRGLRIVWVPERYQTDIESSDVDYRPILSGQCDVQLSAPGAAAIVRFRGRLALSDPYYGAAFELVPANSTFRWEPSARGARGGTPRRKEPYAGTFAVRANSVAHVVLDALGVRWTMQTHTNGILAALRDGSATSALLWGPNLAAANIERNENFEPPAVLRWNLHAIVRRAASVLADINGAFADAAVQREIRALQRRHDIPPHAPFASVHSRAALEALQRP